MRANPALTGAVSVPLGACGPLAVEAATISLNEMNACDHSLIVAADFFLGWSPSTSHLRTSSCARFQSRNFNASRRKRFLPSVPVTQIGHLQRYSLREVNLHRLELWRL